MTNTDILKLIKDKEIEYVDLQFGDMFGMLHHTTFIAENFTEDYLEHGIPFDGSSIRAWKSIDKSDMIFLPDPRTVFIDPFRKRKTLAMFGNIIEPRTGQPYERSPRVIAGKAQEYLRSLGIGDVAYFGPEPEFFIFDNIRYSVSPSTSFYELDSVEGPWTSSNEDENLGHKIRHKMGYFPVTPQDSLMDLRSDITSYMQGMGLHVTLHHHEVGTAQNEISIGLGTTVTCGDNVHKYKYAVKNTAFLYGKTATFMPKPLAGDNGSGMHVHTSIWKQDQNTFAGDGYANISRTGLYAMGGILKHARAMQIFTNPTANSYRRLVPGYEAPVRLAYSATNRSAAIRLPYASSDASRRFEFRCGDASGSPYLSCAAMLMAMIDGIKHKIDPGVPLDKNIYDLPPEELQDIPTTCASLEEAIEEVNNNREFLTEGDVFDDTFIDAFIEHKREEETEVIRLQPTPLEFQLYYDV